jgi:hypothetical protein
MLFGRGLLVGVLSAFAVLWSTPVHAQVAGATLSGAVTDASISPVADAKISITNTATGVVRVVTTDMAGFYNAPNLLPGIYEITAAAPGFSTFRQKDLTLTVGGSQALNISLQIGRVSEHIDVSSTPPDVQLTSSTISAQVDATTVRELPLNGRDWTQLATLQPGVISVRVEQGPSNRGNSGYGTLLTISGHQPFENNYRVDGLSINDYSNGSPGSTLGVNLGVDAIQEFSVLTSNYSAEYGRASGGVINAITKSGTNQFHGDAYWFLRSKRFDARNYFDTTLPPFHRNQFGASGGVPIIKNKTFIFADYEGIRQDKSDTFSNLVPTADARAGNLCMHPDGTCVAPYHVSVDPQVVPYLGLWPLPNVKNPDGTTYIGNGDTGLYNTSGLERLTENYVTIRGDHHFSEKDSLAASWFYDRAPLTQPDTLVDVLTENFTLRQMFSVEETHIFSPAMANTARVGFNRVRALVTAPVSAINPLAKDESLGAIPGRYAPELVVPGIATMDGSLGVISEDVLTWNSYQFYDDAFLTRGTHSLKFGFALEHMQDSEFSGAGANGSFTFPSLAGFLQNQPATVTLDDPTSTRPIYVHQTLFGGYLQDDWRWRSNLTFNIGVRYEPVTLPTEAHNTFAVLTTLTSPAETHVKTLWASNQTLRNFQPRLGFAWDPFRNGKTAVRGGFGIFDVLPLSWEYTHQSTGVLPYELAVGSSNLPQSSFATGAVAQLPFTDPTTVGNRYIEQHPHRNYAMNWNLNIQRELASNVTAAIAYVGSRAVHSPFSTDDSNMVLPTLTSLGYLWPIPGTDPVATGTGGKCADGTNPPCAWPRLNPNVGRIRATFWDNSSTYHGLQAGLAKRMSHGFQAQVSYTWSKCIDMGSGSLLGDPYANSLSSLMFFNRSGRRGVCDFNITHNFVANVLWQPPTPRFGGVLARRTFGGWEMSGIINASTGSPFTVGIAGDPLGQNSTDPKAFASRLSGPGCSNPVNSGNINNYLKLSCFSVPLVPASFAGMCVQAVDTSGNKIPGTCMNLFGNSGRNRVVGPGLFNFDLAAVKNTKIEKISETFNVQFRAEFFNILNHPNFQAPLDNRILFNADGTPVSGAGAIDTTATPPRQIQFGLKVIW